MTGQLGYTVARLPSGQVQLVLSTPEQGAFANVTLAAVDALRIAHGLLGASLPNDDLDTSHEDIER